MFLATVLFRAPEIIPAPVEVSCDATTAVRLDDRAEFRVNCPDPQAADWVRAKARAWWNATPVVTSGAAADVPEGEGAYSLTAAPGVIELSSRSLQGVRYAMQTLRQVAEPIPEGMTLGGYWLGRLKVRDSPATDFRGLHLCAFPELSVRILEHQIRLAAAYKYNYVVLEPWGVFRSERYPFLALNGAYLTVAEARRLAAVARDLGVTLIPQFNVFGHATGSRAVCGKHVTLDFHPERQPLFEPAGGWNWCLTNPATKEVLKGVLAEMHEAFLNPPFVHIGCDEANEPSCARCRAAGPYWRLFAEHVTSIAAAMRGRGARVMMWHDMLLDGGDVRWKGFYANGSAGMAKFLQEEFPKDAVICDWHYGKAPESGDYPTLRHFKGLGFDTVTCPWTDASGIAAQAAFARTNGLCGVLQTVWNRFAGGEFALTVANGASAAWGAPSRERPPLPMGAAPVPHPFATHWRQVGWDMGGVSYAETGYCDNQVSRDLR